MSLLTLIALASFSVAGVQPEGGKPVSTVKAGNCSIVGAGYVSNVKIVCEGIPQKDAEKLLDILQDLLKDNNATDAKLDSVIEMMKHINIAIVPRRLTDPQIQELAKPLTVPTPQPMVIVSAMLDGESTDYANDFAKAFEGGGWKTTRYFRATDKRGVEVGTSEGSEDQYLAIAIAKIFSDKGIAVEVKSFDPSDRTIPGGFEKNVLYIVVNHKPGS